MWQDREYDERKSVRELEMKIAIKKLEKKYDIEYLGEQERFEKSSAFMFNDTQTKSSFMVEKLSEIEEKIKEVRERFRR